jgi:hypothetical protein
LRERERYRWRRHRHNSPVTTNHLADGDGSCGGGGGRLNGEGSLGQFDKKWAREANKGVLRNFFRVQCTEIFWRNCWRPFFLKLMSG